MEAFILVGCLLSVPVIYLSTRPYTPPKEPYKPHSDMDDVETEEPKQTEEQLREAAEKAKARQERLLSSLTPKERVLFKNYLESMRDPTKRKEMAKLQRLDLFVGLVVMLALAGGVYMLVTHW